VPVNQSISGPVATGERRAAERHAPPKPVPATFGGYEVRILDIGLTGCRIEHGDRLPPKARLALKFTWRGKQVRLDGTVVRSELTSLGKKAAYVSGLQFCDSPTDAPPVIRDVVGYLVEMEKKASPPAAPPAPADPPATSPAPAAVDVDDEPEVLSARYLRCALANGQWSCVFVDDPAQPSEGFTIAAPSDEKEADVLRRAYEKGNPEARRTMRDRIARDLSRFTASRS
jgi:hypothetical protein